MSPTETSPRSTPPTANMSSPNSTSEVPTAPPISPTLVTPDAQSTTPAPVFLSPSATSAAPLPNNVAPTTTAGQEASRSPPDSESTGGQRPEDLPAGTREAPEEVNKSEKRGRGKPSNFSGPCLLAMQKGLARYMELTTRREKTQFWPSFMAEILAEFPLSQYPIPASCLAGRVSFVEKTQEEIQQMTPEQKNTYQRSAKLASATEEELYLQMVKDWIRWQQNTARKSDGGTTAALFKAELEKKKKQIKPQFNHFVMKHPDYRETVVGRSSETGRLDRLPSRAQAVKDLLEELPAEEVDALKEEYSELLQGLDGDEKDEVEVPADLATQRSRRKNFGSMAQDVLNIWRKLTGLNLVLLAGECIDGDADYDSCVIFSKPDGCPDMDAGAGVDFNRFSNTFLHWLKDIYDRTHDDTGKTSRGPSNEPSNSSLTPSSTPAATPIVTKSVAVPDTGATCDMLSSSGDPGKQGSRPTGGKKAVRREEWSAGEETPEPSEPSDMGSESEDEEERDSRGSKPFAPVNSEGLWEKNEDGLPVLQVPMCDLTREQQAAFTRECAMAIGLTKALEELNEEMSKSSKGRKASASKYKGMKPTRKSSRIQTTSTVKSKEVVDGNTADSEAEGVVDGQGDDGGEGQDIEMNDGNAGAIDGNQECDSPRQRVIQSVDNVDLLPAWAKAVATGYSEMDTPRMEPWAEFNIEGCSTSFLKGYAGWLLGPENVQRPESWRATVYKWIEVEEEWNKRDVSVQGAQFKMLKNRRPQGFLQWFKYGRLRWEALVPSDVSENTLGYEWWVWWSKVVNPRWRPQSEDMIMPGGQGSWEAVRIPGKDGFILVLVALRWWCDLLDNPEKDLLWVSTIKAVYSTLEELLKDARTNLEGEITEGERDDLEPDDDTEQVEAQSCDNPGVKRKRNGQGTGKERKQRC
ncbi:SERTA domain-containing protein 3 [Paramarasmius palmivorus]|uniref:SERTA domain-containing protein 3 n=1 Tax=Paramarasmius palmivorus TaxID=297713 RepID=A0AAW0BJX4_9AGAR